ncbi:MAG TPA: plastocyanin/azurin family copper-binding protein [Solirubrobacteraceae bacterium]|nr:plastocyanin/azurin family copper-binding protein [Solirubrobacteraceae bacterium]
MRKLLVAVLVTAVVAALAAPAVAATVSVKVGDNYYVRSKGVPNVTVSRDTSVVWRFRGTQPHNVTVSRGPAKFRSKTKSSGTYRRTVTRAGTYTIYCSIHGASEQKMKLVVR